MKFLFLAGVFVPIYSLAQLNPSGTESHIMRSDGQFFTVRLVMGEPLRIFVVGKEEAKLDLSKMTLTVRRTKPYPGKILKVDRNNNYFTVRDPDDLKKATEIELSAKLAEPTNSEIFHFELKDKK